MDISKKKKKWEKQSTNCYEIGKNPTLKASNLILFLLASRSGMSQDGDAGQLAEPPTLSLGQKTDAVFPATEANQQEKKNM